MEALRSDLRNLGIDEDLGRVNWTYDDAGKHIDATERAGAIVMGFNASSGGKGSEARWKNKCTKLTEGLSPNFMLAELVLIATHRISDSKKLAF